MNFVRYKSILLYSHRAKMLARHATAARPGRTARGLDSTAFRFNGLSRTLSQVDALSKAIPAPSRVDIEITIGDEGQGEGSGPSGPPGPSTSGRHPSLSLSASLDATAFEECALLVMIYNLERRRAELLAERVLDLFDRDAELAKTCEATLPGLTLRLQRHPEGACEALSSIEVLLKIVHVVDRDQAAGLVEDVKAMVSLHASSVGSRTREAMRSLPETPMWQSIFWRATDAIIGRDALRRLTDGDVGGAGDSLGDSQGDSGSSNLGERAVLRLRCNSKTAGQGLPMTVSVRIEVGTSDELRDLLAQRLSDSYFGKSLAQISTSVWTSLRLSREGEVSGTIRLEDADGTNGAIQIASMDDLDAVTMALAYLTGDGSDGRGRGGRHDGSRAVRDAWVPADARIRFSRSRGATGASTYRVSGVDDVASTIEIRGQFIDGLIDALDALRAIDPLFVTIV